MKNLLKISLLFVAVLVMFSSCKKDEMSITSPELTLTGDDEVNYELNVYQEDLSISLMVAPEDAPDGEITVKATSIEDPTGIEFTIKLSDGDYTEGKVKYLYKRGSDIIYAANHTDADAGKLKVSPNGDVITVVVGDNLISDTYNVNCEDKVALTYWGEAEATIFVYGYSFDGSENLTVQAWSSRDISPLDIDLEYNDPTQYNGLPSFNNYSYTFSFVDSWSSYNDTLMGIYPTSTGIADTVFVKYNNVTYYSVFPTNTFMPMSTF